MNRKLVEKIIDRLEAVPESYDQEAFCVEDDGRAPCGTVACLAGEAVICNAATPEKGIAEARRLLDKGGITYVAQKLLRLPYGHGLFSFNAGDWPKPYNLQMEEAKSRKKRARIAVAYLKEALERETMIW